LGWRGSVDFGAHVGARAPAKPLSTLFADQSILRGVSLARADMALQHYRDG
jgi:hypothetical protein